MMPDGRKSRDTAKTLTHSASQVCADIWLFKQKLQAQHNRQFTHEEVAAFYSKHLSGADSDEEPRSDPKLIEKAVTVYEQVLLASEVRDIIRAMDEFYEERSPFNSIANLLDVHYQCRNPARVLWFFQSVQLALKLEQLEPEEMNRKYLLKPGTGKVSMLQVFLLKKGLKDFFLTRFLDTRNVSVDYKNTLRKVLKDPPTYFNSFLASRLICGSLFFF